MKVLTVRQPWAQLIILGIKKWETRAWSTNHRGPLAIHAAKSMAPLMKYPPWLSEVLRRADYPRLEALPRGQIIGTVTLKAVEETAWLKTIVEERELQIGLWDYPGWAWKLQDPRKLPIPIRCPGEPGLWEVPDDLCQLPASLDI